MKTLFAMACAIVLGALAPTMRAQDADRAADGSVPLVAAARLSVTDLGESIIFYERLGCALVFGDAESPFAVLSDGTNSLVLTPAPGKIAIDRSACHVRINFLTADLENRRSELREAGVAFVGDIEQSAVGRSAAFMDPTGHVHGLKELAENAREGGIYNVGIVVQNMKEAERFYGAVLGFEIFSRDYYPPVIPMRDASERVPFILSERGAGKAPYESGVTAFAGLAIEVADIDAEIERLRPLGVKMLDPEPRLTANVLHMTIADPFGNLHEIIQHLDPAELEARMARQSPTTGTPAIADLAWLSGQWRLERGTDDASETLEETWSPATGDAMTGMFRWMRGDNVWLYELMSIEQTGDELTFHLRHFGRGLRVWDSEFEKLTPFAYPLKTANTNRLVFENPDRDQPRTIVYTRDSDTLTVELLGPDGTGMSFTFNRVQSDR